MKYSPEEKMEVLNDDTFNHFLDCKRSLYGLYLQDLEGYTEARKPSFEFWCECFRDEVDRCWDEFRDLNSGRTGEAFSRSFSVCRAIYNNHKARSSRLRHKIEEWNKIGALYFITLTFSPVALDRSSGDARRKAVQRFLNDLGVLYCANIDFGDKNEREHYHAIICSPEDLPGSWVKDKGVLFLKSFLFDTWAQSYGFYNIQRVSLSDEKCDAKRISKYISKLTNHALKKSTTGARFVCNRKIPSWAKERGYV